MENERQYDSSRFNNNVCTEFSFEDHNPPTIQMIISFCQHVETQLNSMADRTIVIHCKAGKVRSLFSTKRERERGIFRFFSSGSNRCNVLLFSDVLLSR